MDIYLRIGIVFVILIWNIERKRRTAKLKNRKNHKIEIDEPEK
jgi:hypothetical protein